MTVKENVVQLTLDDIINGVTELIFEEKRKGRELLEKMKTDGFSSKDVLAFNYCSANVAVLNGARSQLHCYEHYDPNADDIAEYYEKEWHELTFKQVMSLYQLYLNYYTESWDVNSYMDTLPQAVQDLIDEYIGLEYYPSAEAEERYSERFEAIKKVEGGRFEVEANPPYPPLQKGATSERTLQKGTDMEVDNGN